MLKLSGLLLVVSLCGCYTAMQNKSVAEPSDPMVGDLHCARPRLTILEALYERPGESAAPVVCQAPDVR